MTQPRGITPEWIALDWRTGNLRAYAMRGSETLDRATSNDGMNDLTTDGFAPRLRRLIAPWLAGTIPPIIACGMVGARQGWVEAPYRQVPCTPLGTSLTRATGAGGLAVHIIAGLSQAQPADVMRGEETQIAGFLTRNPGFDGVLCLPGAHTKWVHLSAGEVVSFRTFMTGELFALLAESSVLRHSVYGAGLDQDSFNAGVSVTLSRPEALAAELFGLRASDQLDSAPAGRLRGRLSGLLVGAELAATRAYWLGQNLAIMGMGDLAQAYRDALEPQGVPALMVDGDAATLSGLCTAYRHLQATA